MKSHTAVRRLLGDIIVDIRDQGGRSNGGELDGLRQVEASKGAAKDQLQLLTEKVAVMGECLNQLSKVKGKGKMGKVPGTGKAAGKGCFTCGEVGHIAAPCPMVKGKGKGKAKGDAKGKGKGLSKGGKAGGQGFGFRCFSCGQRGTSPATATTG